jgi:predicted dehydrogenase
MSGPVRAVIVGGGWMGKLHAECLAEIPEALVVGLVEPSSRSAADFTAAFDVPVFDSVAGAARSGADLACICAPSGLHAPLAIEALAVGCHVVVEKPLATTVADGERMIEAARAAGRTLSVILQYRFNRDALLLKRMVERGLLGEILFANVANYIRRDGGYFGTNGGWRGTWELNGGGVLINQTTHGMDLLDWYMGPVTAARASAATRFHPIDVEDTLSAVIDFAGGATGFVQATSAADRDYPLRLEIVGRAGTAVFERARLSTVNVEPRAGDLLTEDELAALPPGPGDASGEPFGRAHRRQYRAVLAALRTGGEPPVPAREALGSLRAITAIYQAAGLLAP